MLDRADFPEILQRIRAGDQEAAAECVRHFEPEIRRAARLRMTDPRLRRLIDSMDICQSVFGRFFIHAANGAFELEEPEHLLSLLVTMTRNRVTDMGRRQQTEMRDVRREQTQSGSQIVAPGPGPGSVAIGKELLRQVRERLSPDELDLVERRDRGEKWQEIADTVGSSPEAVRKQLQRALDRVRDELGME